MRVLSIDGGGIRGLIPAIVLTDIERRTGRRIAELFDLVAGTSTGGILACALTAPSTEDPAVPRLSAEELAGLYETEGPKIFSRSLLKRLVSLEGFVDERYDDAGLHGALDRFLGPTRLRDALTPLFVTAYDIAECSAFFFRSARAVEDPAFDFAMVDVARATSAAPTYFEPVEVAPAAGGRRRALIDGGVFATNPAMCAYADIVRAGRASELVVSLGTGQHTRPLTFGTVRGWGQLEWARPIIDVVFDGVADTVDFQLGQLLADGDYIRLQTELNVASDDLDDASPENLERLRQEAATIIHTRDADIEALCARLVR